MAYIGNQPKWNASTHTPQSADPSNPVEGMVFYSDGTSRAEGLWVYKDGAWQEVGSQTSDLTVYGQFDAEDLSTVDFVNITTTTSSPIAGDASYSVDAYTAEFPTLTLNDRNKNKINAVKLHYKMTSGTAKLVVIDNAANTLGELEISSTTVEQAVLQYYVPDSATSIQLQIEDVSSATGLVVDDVVFTDNPFAYKNLTQAQFIHFDDLAGYGSTNNKIPYFTNERRNEVGPLTVENDSTNGFSLTANKACRVTCSFNQDPNSGFAVGMSLNSNQLTTDISSIDAEDRIAYAVASTNGFDVLVTTTIKMEVGDVLRPHTSGAASTSPERNLIIAVAETEADAVLTPTKNVQPTIVNKTNSQTISASDQIIVFNNIVSDIDGNFNTSTGEYTCPRAGVVAVNGAFLRASGTSAGGNYQISIFKNSDKQFGAFTYPDSTNSGEDANLSGLVKVERGDVLTVRGSNSASNLELPSGSEDFIFATFNYIDVLPTAVSPLPLTAFIKHVENTGVDGGGATSGSWNTRVLNTTEGDTEFVSLSSNQFTLPAGKYILEGKSAFLQTGNIKSRIQNITDATTLVTSTTNHHASGTFIGEVYSFVDTVFEISEEKTFELQYQVSDSKATNGLGTAAGQGVDEVYAVIKLTKLFGR